MVALNEGLVIKKNRQKVVRVYPRPKPLDIDGLARALLSFTRHMTPEELEEAGRDSMRRYWVEKWLGHYATRGLVTAKQFKAMADYHRWVKAELEGPLPKT